MQPPVDIQKESKSKSQKPSRKELLEIYRTKKAQQEKGAENIRDSKNLTKKNDSSLEKQRKNYHYPARNSAIGSSSKCHRNTSTKKTKKEEIRKPLLPFHNNTNFGSATQRTFGGCQDQTPRSKTVQSDLQTKQGTKFGPKFSGMKDKQTSLPQNDTPSCSLTKNLEMPISSKVETVESIIEQSQQLKGVAGPQTAQSFLENFINNPDPELQHIEKSAAFWIAKIKLEDEINDGSSLSHLELIKKAEAAITDKIQKIAFSAFKQTYENQLLDNSLEEVDHLLDTSADSEGFDKMLNISSENSESLSEISNFHDPESNGFFCDPNSIYHKAMQDQENTLTSKNKNCTAKNLLFSRPIAPTKQSNTQETPRNYVKKDTQAKCSTSRSKSKISKAPSGVFKAGKVANIVNMFEIGNNFQCKKPISSPLPSNASTGKVRELAALQESKPLSNRPPPFGGKLLPGFKPAGISQPQNGKQRSEEALSHYLFDEVEDDIEAELRVTELPSNHELNESYETEAKMLEYTPQQEISPRKKDQPSMKLTTPLQESNIFYPVIANKNYHEKPELKTGTSMVFSDVSDESDLDEECFPKQRHNKEKKQPSVTFNIDQKNLSGDSESCVGKKHSFTPGSEMLPPDSKKFKRKATPYRSRKKDQRRIVQDQEEQESTSKTFKRKATPRPSRKKDPNKIVQDREEQEGSFYITIPNVTKSGTPICTPVRRSRRLSSTPTPVRSEMENYL